MPKMQLPNATGQMVEVENVTPTWEEILPMMLLTLESLQSNRYQTRDQREATDNLKNQFFEMAKAADNWNESQA